MKYRVSYSKTVEVCGDAIIEADSLEELQQKFEDEEFVDFEEDEGGSDSIQMIGEPVEVSKDTTRISLRA